jgi:hypothetical protein
LRIFCNVHLLSASHHTNLDWQVSARAPSLNLPGAESS